MTLRITLRLSLLVIFDYLLQWRLITIVVVNHFPNSLV